MENLISIIVPVYNVQNYLEKCLDSIVGQTYVNIEIICVNDGSTDNSLDILKKYGKIDSRIKIIDQKNKGLSGARNSGIKAATGKYIMFVDSDDWIDLETCEIALKAAVNNSADLIFWSYTREFNENSKEKKFFWEDGKIFEDDEVKKSLHRRLCGLISEELAHPDYANAFETAWGKLYLTENLIINNIEFVDTKEIGTEDALFNLYALGFVKKAVYIKKCLYHYRKTNNTSLTSVYKKNLFIQWQNLFSKMKSYIEKNNLSSEYVVALDNRIALSILGLGLNIMYSDFSYTEKIKKISEILNSEIFINAYKNLEFKYFPLHWKIFYKFAKMRFAPGVYFLLLVIVKIKNK